HNLRKRSCNFSKSPGISSYPRAMRVSFVEAAKFCLILWNGGVAVKFIRGSPIGGPLNKQPPFPPVLKYYLISQWA
ncbi:MAG: hypothetical protein SV775_10460, partial [Thermodesulfobacteriota bacterium]|nr:hypothetical protein [Thermodesulfobacteriota bacterium]